MTGLLSTVRPLSSMARQELLLTAVPLLESYLTRNSIRSAVPGIYLGMLIPFRAVIVGHRPAVKSKRPKNSKAGRNKRHLL
jgi:hypothetical protein